MMMVMEMSDIDIMIDEFLAQAYEKGARTENDMLEYVNLFAFNSLEETYILQRVAEIFHNEESN